MAMPPDGRLGPLRWEVGRVRKYLTEECCNRADRRLPSDAIDCPVHLCENNRRNLAITSLGSRHRFCASGMSSEQAKAAAWFLAAEREQAERAS
jgi:hypothetical protein